MFAGAHISIMNLMEICVHSRYHASAAAAAVDDDDDDDFDVDVDVVAKQNYSNFKVNEFVRIRNTLASLVYRPLV